MQVSRTIRVSIAVLLAASASMCAWAGDTGASSSLAIIQRTLNTIDLKLSAAEQDQASFRLKLGTLTELLDDDGVDLKVLLDSALELLDLNDAIGRGVGDLDRNLAGIADSLQKMLSDTSNSDTRLAEI